MWFKNHFKKVTTINCLKTPQNIPMFLWEFTCVIECHQVVWLPLIETRCSFIWMSLLLMMLLHLKKTSFSSTDLQIRQHVCGQYRLTELCNVAEEFHDDEECNVFNALCLQKRPPSVQQKEWGMGCLWVRICRLFLEGRIIRETRGQYSIIVCRL